MEARLQRQHALSETRRALVLDAARAVFEEQGFEGASIREVARRAGYTPGAIYSYFESQEAIYGALLAESLERLNTAVGHLNQGLNARWHAALAPAVRAMRLDGPTALRENTALFAQGIGLLLLQHTGRIRVFRQDASALFTYYLDALCLRAQNNHGNEFHAA